MKIKTKALLILMCIVALIALGSYLLFKLSKSRKFQFFGGITHRVNTDKKVIALTFDDAPTSHTNDVLGILEDKGVKATFYVVGKNIEKYPDEAKSIVAHGHEIGNHSYSHQRFLLKSFSFVEQEIQKTNELIRSAGYEREITFRPPNGKKLVTLPWYLHQHNIKTIMWDVEPDTYASHLEEGEDKTKLLIEYTVKNTKPGAIILIHPLCNSCASDRKALATIIEKLQEEGYMFVTVSELLNTKP